MEAGNRSAEWLREEFCGIDLGNGRLDRRLIKTAESLGKPPASPINEACGDWAGTQATYRLFDNDKASPAAIREPHIAATTQRMVACGGPVWVAQDTVFFSYGEHPRIPGSGADCQEQRGA
ncbi:MAG: IS4/Tn5 family transposase DNA-binding protein [Steroidobacteraceae bacterium]